jgi:hypothetical protein
MTCVNQYLLRPHPCRLVVALVAAKLCQAMRYAERVSNSVCIACKCRGKECSIRPELMPEEGELQIDVQGDPAGILAVSLKIKAPATRPGYRRLKWLRDLAAQSRDFFHALLTWFGNTAIKPAVKA